MKHYRRIFSLLLAIAMLTISAFAAAPVGQRSVNVDGKQIYVQMANGAPCTWSDAEIYALLEGTSPEDGMLITIWGVKEAEKSLQSGIAPLWYESYKNELMNTSGEQTERSELLFSIPRGGSTTLSRRFESFFEFKLTGTKPYDLASIKAEGTIRTGFAYERSDTYYGPSEGSRYNTRLFYVNHYYVEETWKQTEYDFALRPQGSIVTTVKRPVRSVEFSLDSYESLN